MSSEKNSFNTFNLYFFKIQWCTYSTLGGRMFLCTCSFRSRSKYV